MAQYMYLDDYLKILKKNIIFILTLSVLGAIVAYMSTSFVKSGYNIEQTMFLKVDKTDPQTIESLDRQALTDTTVAILTSQDFQRTTGISGAATTAKKLASQVILVSTTSPDEALTKNAHSAAISKFNSTSQNLITNASVQLIPTGERQDPTKKILNSRILAAFGALIGFCAALSIISVSRYFKI